MRPRRRQPTRFPRPWDFPGKSTEVGCHCHLQELASDVENSDWPRNQWTRCALWLQVNFPILGRYLLATKTIRSTWEALIWLCLVAQMVVSVCSAGDRGLIPGLGRSPGEGNGSPLQYSCLENYMDGGACVHGVAKSRTEWVTSLWLSLSLIPALVLRHLWISFQAANIFEPILETLWNENLPEYPQPLWKIEGRLGLYHRQCNQRWQKMWAKEHRAALAEALKRPIALPTGRPRQDTSPRQEGCHMPGDSFCGPARLAWQPQTTSSWCPQPESVIGNFHSKNQWHLRNGHGTWVFPPQGRARWVHFSNPGYWVFIF